MTKTEILKPYIDFYKKHKKIVLISLIVWFVLIIVIGIIMGFYLKPEMIILTPEEENAKAMKIIKSEIPLIESGKLLSTRNNMTFTEIEYSSNYVNSRKNNSGKGE